MSEGELKKRIIDRAGYSAPYVEIVPETLWNILDEAKKDFPVEDMSLDRDFFFADSVKDWFKKWFGDEE
jgi:hypothetical protein